MTARTGGADDPQLPDNPPQLTAQGASEAEARYNLILSRHGSQLNDEQKKWIRTLSTYAQPSLDRVRAFTLRNGDVPALFLKPIVEREKTSQAASSKKD